MSKRRPDPVDERILRLLVRNARASWREIGDEVGLSANAVAQRVRRLEVDGWVRGYTAQLDPGLSGQTTTAVVLLSTDTHVANSEIEQRMAAMPEVVEVLDLAGAVDYQVRVRVSGTAGLYDVVNALRELPGVVGIETRPVLREVLAR